MQNDFLFDGSVISKHRTGDGFQSRLFMYRAFRILNDPTMLKELTEEGKEVSMLVFGSSMAPFLIHARDMIYFKKPDRELQKGDIVFFRRKSGQFVMHRIWKIRPEGYYIVGDAQTQIEGPVKREQIFALITKVRRKEKWLEPGDFWWEFFEHVWLHMIPLRRGIMWCYAKVIK